jgi:3-oxoadipate CoA-transferase beta subunit
LLEAAARLAADLPRQGVVNLGRGLPGLVASAMPEVHRIQLQAENGIIGVGPAPPPELADWSLTDASKRPVTLRPGAAVFDLGASFDMIRGGRIDIAVLGAFQVSERGDLANHALGDPDFPPAVGGAMDLAVGAREVWVLMRHYDRSGARKFVERCGLPLTAAGVVRRVYTELATIFLPRNEPPVFAWRSPALLELNSLRTLPITAHRPSPDALATVTPK